MTQLNYFHPAVRDWFLGQFPAATEPQARAWPAIKQRTHTLIAAPTGSGKTLAAFLSAIDDLVSKAIAGKRSCGNDEETSAHHRDYSGVALHPADQRRRAKDVEYDADPNRR